MTAQVDAWTGEEAQKLLRVAKEHEPTLHPLLALLLGTGMRRGKALGLRWADIDFENTRVTVRRSWSKRHLTTPKSGVGRTVPPGRSLVEREGLHVEPERAGRARRKGSET